MISNVMTNTELKEFIKDYYANMSYAQLFLKYGLKKRQADKLWEDVVNKDKY